MQPPSALGEWINYTCNVCGSRERLPSAGFHRELAQCACCGSTPRFRGIVDALGRHLGQPAERALVEWDGLEQWRGMGFSDWEGYAAPLARCCDYQNTHYEREPRFDIQQLNEERRGRYDFVLCSDVFEHVAPPLECAFANLLALLKPGGLLVFSVPYHRAGPTQEHFPGLWDFEIVPFRGEPLLINRDAGGRLQVYDRLVFHGGGGATLELRLFSEADVLEHLQRAGFTALQVLDQPRLECGYYWPPLAQADPAAPPLYAYLITARRPPAAC